MDPVAYFERLRSNAQELIERSKLVIGSAFTRKQPVRVKKERDGLPLLLPSSWPPPTLEKMEIIDSVMELFRELSLELLLMLHNIHKNLHFWRVRLQGSDSMKLWYTVFERGPRAFGDGVASMLRAWIVEGSPTQKLVYDAAYQMNEKQTMLFIVQQQLAAFLAQIYVEVNKLGRADQGKAALRLALINVYDALNTLYDLPPNVEHDQSPLKDAKQLHIKELSPELLAKEEWSDEDIETVVQCMYVNLKNIKDCIATLMPLYERPTRLTRFWFRYTASALVVALFSAWLFKHSRFAGSKDLENWTNQGAQAFQDFWQEHVEEPLLSIRDELFETFRKRHQGATEPEDLKLTSESLSRMLKAFAEQTYGSQLPPNPTDQQLMAIMMGRYEKELMHPIQNLVGGELVRALLIQVQKLKRDIETAMLELNQILRANEINFAILAAFPALVFAVFLGYLARISISKSWRREGVGRSAHRRRRMLVAEAERAIMQHQLFKDQNQERESLWQYGMVLYALDQLYRSLVAKNDIAKEEWFSLREDVMDLVKPSLDTSYKLLITARMGRVYECLAPHPRLK